MDAYYQTPNIYIPLNKRDKGEIADVAKLQLQEWQELAISWPRYPEDRAVRCGYCSQCLYFTHDINGVMYAYTDEEKLAVTVGHIRQNHGEYIK